MFKFDKCAKDPCTHVSRKWNNTKTDSNAGNRTRAFLWTKRMEWICNERIIIFYYQKDQLKNTNCVFKLFLIIRRPSWCRCPRDFGWSTHPILATFLRWSSSSSRQSVLSWKTSPCCRSLDCLCQTMTRCHACDGFRCRGGHQESAPGNCHEPFLIECSLVAVAKISTSVVYSVSVQCTVGIHHTLYHTCFCAN